MYWDENGVGGPGWYVANDGSGPSPIYISGDINATQLSWSWSMRESHSCTATRVHAPGYVLGDQTDKALMPIEEVSLSNATLYVKGQQTNVVVRYANGAVDLGVRRTISSSHPVGDGSIVEGTNTSATARFAHAEGYSTYARADGAHAEGYSTYARGNYSHAEGYETTAVGRSSYAGGYRAVSAESGQNLTTTNAHVSAFVWQGRDDTTTILPYYHSHGNGTFNINPVGGTSGFYIGATNLNTYLSNEVALTIKEFSGWSCDPAQIEIDGRIWDAPYGLLWWGDAEYGYLEGWYCMDMEQGEGPYWLSPDINATNLEWSVNGIPIVATRSPLRYQLGSQLDKQIPSFAMVKNIQEQVSNKSLVGKLYNTENPVDFTNAVWDIVRALGGSVTNFPVSNP